MKYKVGDKVRVRSWDSMASEYGVDCCCSIKATVSLIKEMRKYCETVMTICCIGYNFYYMQEDDKEWKWSDDMLEDVISPEAQKEMDRAMEWCVEYLREHECHCEDWRSCGLAEDSENWLDLDYRIETCIRYLQKVEEGLEGE